MADETKKERIDRELKELLEEVRVAIPGAEVLFAFQLGVAFTSRFADLDGIQRAVFFVALLLTAGATALLMAPTAYHRIRFREDDKERMLFSATKMALASLVMLSLALTAVIYLVTDLIYAAPAAPFAAAAAACWFGWFWFGLPLVRRAEDSG